MSISFITRDVRHDADTTARRLLALWLPLAKRGHAHAQFVIGALFLHGRGMTQNYDIAADWLAQAAHQRHPEAQLHYGLMYLRGVGVVRDERVAAHWLRLAAEQGVLRAQCYLSRMYAFGVGMSRSLVYAYMWAMLAAMGKWRAGTSARSNHDKLRNYALYALEHYSRTMTREEVATAIRMVKRWRQRYLENRAAAPQ